MKLIDKKMMSSKETDLVLEEIKILKTIQHPNIIKLLEVMDLPSEVVCLVLEYAGGGTLFDYIRIFGKLSEQEACKLFLQLADAVDACHKASIVHRGIISF